MVDFKKIFWTKSLTYQKYFQIDLEELRAFAASGFI
jgi:hypothetical protein